MLDIFIIIKIPKLVELNAKIVSPELNTETLKDNLMLYKSLCCYRSCQKRFDEDLRKRFANRYKFSNDGFDKFILLSKKCVYPHE